MSEPADLPPRDLSDDHAAAAELPSPAQEPMAGAAPPSHAVLRYSALRFAILVGVGALLYAVGLRGLLLLVFAFLISGVISIFALNRTRENAAYGITSAVVRANERIDASSRAEDDDPDDDLAEYDTSVAPSSETAGPDTPESR